MHFENIIKEIQASTWRKARPAPNKTALLVIDMQEYFRSVALEIIPNVQTLVVSCRKNSIPVIFTQHGHRDPTMDGGMLAQWWEELIMVGTRDWEIIPELSPEPGDKIIAKKRYSAFFETDLDVYLKDLRITDLLITGVMTNLCCETTAREAFMRDYRVFFLADATATSEDEFHLASLKNLAFGFAYIVTCEEVIRWLDEGFR
ncbi:MAG: isochorismatase family protein [candidate division KSB1 bacterium]|nr:isochorismatase family protein [candidate division KSB1 bacterium]